jgi:hypothetical protein
LDISDEPRSFWSILNHLFFATQFYFLTFVQMKVLLLNTANEFLRSFHFSRQVYNVPIASSERHKIHTLRMNTNLANIVICPRNEEAQSEI